MHTWSGSALFNNVQDNIVTIFNYIPLSEARKVALYILFFTFGDSLSKTAIVVICPFTGSIFNQLAGSDNFVYLQNESAVSLNFLIWCLKNKAYITALIPNVISSINLQFCRWCLEMQFNLEKYFCGSGFGRHMRIVYGQACLKHQVSAGGEILGAQSPCYRPVTDVILSSCLLLSTDSNGADKNIQIYLLNKP